MTREQAVRLPLSLLFGLSVLFSGFARVSPLAAQPSQRPNLILILTDDQQWVSIDYMPKLQNYFVQQGIKFTNSFVTTSICCPSRSSILTGLYAHNHRVLHNDGGFDVFDDSSTLATWLHDAGYRTGLVGKYLNGYSGTYIPPGWDDWHAIITQSKYYNYNLSENGKVKRFKTATTDYITDVLAARALSFIRAGGSAPFFLYFAPNAPHGPSTPAERHRSLFNNLPPWRPPNYNEADVSDKPAWIKQLASLSASEQQRIDDLRKDQIRCLQAVDEAVEAIINAVAEIGATDNTIIVFMSDNGFMWGEHRQDGKFAQYEESIRVPLLLRAPGMVSQARVENQFALNIDIAPTFAELAGAQPGSAIDGESLRRIVDGVATSSRGDFLVEAWKEIKPNQKATIPENAGVRNNGWKYVEYVNGDKELYDLNNDPYELNNRANNPAFAAVQAELAQRLQQLKTGIGCTEATAAFRADSRTGCNSLAVNFTDESTGAVASRLWDFGDGSTSTVQNPSHVYVASGIYTVKLKVSSAHCSDTETKFSYINVGVAPTAGFTGTSATGNAPLTVNFADQSTGAPTSWAWTFGDGASSSVQNPSHQYNSPGTYSVSLTASNTCGTDIETKSSYITVTSVPVNLALNKPATASSTVSAERAPAKAVDGNIDTYWRNGSLISPQTSWLRVDLQSPQMISRGVVKWRGSYYAKKYQFQVSTDNLNWTTVFINNAGTSGTHNFTFPGVNARYVRLYMTELSSENYRLNELEVYAGAGALAQTSITTFPDPEIVDETVGDVPDDIALRPNAPNPFNPETRINFSLPEDAHVSIKVYNLLGEEVATVIDEPRAAGNHTVDFHPENLSSGVYFYVLDAGATRLVRRMTLVK